MKINLIGHSFDKNSGQGICKYSEELYENLKKRGLNVVKNGKGDLIHLQQPELIFKVLLKKNVITTIHDVMPIFNNERHILVRICFYFSALLTCLKSKKIIAISECTKKDIEKYFPFSRKKVIVVLDGMDSHKFFPAKRKKNKRATIGYLGGLGKRKNIEFIINLARIIPETDFVIGGKGPQLERLKSIKERLNVNNVKFSGFIEDSKINKFYNSLDLFIFPSLYEGFGLPILEAMACGVPCLISDRGSLPETAGDAGVLLDIDNLEKSEKIIRDLIKDKKKIKKLSEKSLERAKKFTWKKCAKQTEEVYREVLK